MRPATRRASPLIGNAIERGITLIDTGDFYAHGHNPPSPARRARAIAFAIEQPCDVDVGDIVVRPTAQA